MLNAGHRRGAMAGRCVIRGKNVETEELPDYCAVALAGLNDLPDTIMTRSIIVRMRRRAPNEIVQPWRMRVNGPQAHKLAEGLALWSTRPFELAWPDMPEGVHDRAADVWEALLAVADHAGGHWPRRARVAAVALVADSRGNRRTLGIQLLEDLRRVFGRSEALATEVILDALIGQEESPWGDLRGKPIDSRSLAHRLRNYTDPDGQPIQPTTIRLGDRTLRGYRRADLEDAWARYLPPRTSATSATSETSDPDPAARVALVADVALQRDDTPDSLSFA